MSESDARTRVVFIGGLGRSGTTLLERLLGQLPKTLPLGEVAHLWERDVRDDESCACGSVFSACEFWQRVGAAAFGGWSNVDVDRIAELGHVVDRTKFIPTLAGKQLRAPHADMVAEYCGYYEKLYAAAAADAGAQIVIDSSKHASLAYCLRWSEEIDLRVVHVVRDSRGVAYSWTKRVQRPESGDGGEMTRYSPTRTAMLWNAQNAAFGLLRRRGIPVRRIRYEELIASPRLTVERLANWMKQPVTDDQLRFIGDDWADLGPSHSAAGNPMRFTVGRVALRHDDAWTTHLPASRRRLVSTLTRPLLHRYGYRDNDADDTAVTDTEPTMSIGDRRD